MTSPAQAKLINDICAITYNTDEATARKLLANLFKTNNVSTAIIQTWNDEAAFDAIQTGHPDKPTGTSPAPSKNTVFYNQASPLEIKEALKRLGQTPDKPWEPY